MIEGIHEQVAERLGSICNQNGEWFDSLVVIATYRDGGQWFKRVAGVGNDYARRESAREWLRDREEEGFFQEMDYSLGEEGEIC